MKYWTSLRKSIYIIRESYFHFRDQMAMLWSIGKDSTVMLWLVRKAFAGKVPFPLVHIDTTFKIPEMITFRDQVVQKLGLEDHCGCSNTKTPFKTNKHFWLQKLRDLNAVTH